MHVTAACMHVSMLSCLARHFQNWTLRVSIPSWENFDATREAFDDSAGVFVRDLGGGMYIDIFIYSRCRRIEEEVVVLF